MSTLKSYVQNLLNKTDLDEKAIRFGRGVYGQHKKSVAATKTLAYDFPRLRKQYIQPKIEGLPVWLQTPARVTADVASVATGGQKKLFEGIERMKKPGLGTKISGAAQTLYGAGTTITPFLPATAPKFLAASYIANLPKQTFKSPLSGEDKPIYPWYQRAAAGFTKRMTGIEDLAPQVQAKPFQKVTLSLPIIGDISFDLAETAGGMAGFTQHPVNKILFNLTEKYIPSNGNLKKWLSTTIVRGGIEDIFLNLDQMPDDASITQKIQFLSQNFLVGATTEVVTRGTLKGVFEGVDKVLNTKTGEWGVKNLVKVYDELKKAQQGLSILVWNRAAGTSMPMWKWKLKDMFKDQSGFMKIPEMKPEDLKKRFKSKAVDIEGLKTEYKAYAQSKFKDYDAKIADLTFDKISRLVGGDLERIAEIVTRITKFDHFKTGIKSILGDDYKFFKDVNPPHPAEMELKPETLGIKVVKEPQISTKVVKPEQSFRQAPEKMISKSIKQPKKTSVDQVLMDINTFKELGTRENQLKASKYIQKILHQYVEETAELMKKKGINPEDFKKDFQSGGNKYPEIIKRHQEFIKQAETRVKEIDPNFTPKENYYHETDLLGEGANVFKEVEEGLWISAADTELGAFKPNRGILKGSADYAEVHKSYANQLLKKVYLNNMIQDDPLKQTVVDFSRQVGDAIRGGKGTKNIPTPDFITEGNKLQKTTKKINYRLENVGAILRTNDNVMKNIGGNLNAKWRAFRDVTTKFGDNYRINNILRNRVLQDFVEEASKYEFDSKITHQYVNDMIANMISVKQYEKNVVDKMINGMVEVFSMAHLGLSVKTGLLQLLEMSKLPAIFKPDEIYKGIKKVGIKDADRIIKEYRLDEFDNPYDIKRAKLEIKQNIGVKAYDKFKDILFYPIAKGERIKNVYFASIAEVVGIKKGLNGDELVSFVRDVLFRYGNIASKNNRAKLYNNSLGRLAFQYGQYNLKNAQEIFDRVQYKQYGKAMGLAASQIFNIGLIVGITGLPAKYAIEQLAPLGLGPIFTFPSRLYDTITNKGSEESKEKKIKRLLTQNIIPAGTQYIRTSEGLQASKGFDYTPSGRVRYFGDEAPLPIKVKGIVFGKYSLPNVQKYYKESTQELGDIQSEVFKSLPKSDAKKYAEEVLSGRKVEKEIRMTKEVKGEDYQIQASNISSKIHQISDGRAVVKIGKEWKTYDTPKDAQYGLSKYNFEKKNGKYDYKSAQYSLMKDRTKRKDDIKTWFKEAEIYINYLSKYIKEIDPESSKYLNAINKIEDILADMEKFAKYGGFKKPKKGKKPKAINIKKLTIKSRKLAKLPSIAKALKISKAPSVGLPPTFKIKKSDDIKISTAIAKPLPIQKKFGKVRAI